MVFKSPRSKSLYLIANNYLPNGQFSEDCSTLGVATIVYAGSQGTRGEGTRGVFQVTPRGKGQCKALFWLTVPPYTKRNLTVFVKHPK